MDKGWFIRCEKSGGIMDLLKMHKAKYIGVGGTKCSCCNPYKGRGRKKLNRMARSSLKSSTKKEVLSFLQEDLV